MGPARLEGLRGWLGSMHRNNRADVFHKTWFIHGLPEQVSAAGVPLT
jgi:hypothetical protein